MITKNERTGPWPVVVTNGAARVKQGKSCEQGDYLKENKQLLGAPVHGLQGNELGKCSGVAPRNI